MDVISMHIGTLGMHGGRPPAMGVAIERVIDVAHQARLEVMAWPPGPADAVRLAGAGADALCVDDVPGVLSALAAR